MDNRPSKRGPGRVDLGGWLGDVEGAIIASAINPHHWTSDTSRVRNRLHSRTFYDLIFDPHFKMH